MMKFDEIESPDPQLIRYLDPVDIALVKFLVSQSTGPNLVLEIGVLFGGWSISVLLNSDENTNIFGVDPFDWPQGGVAVDTLTNNLKSYGVSSRFKLARNLSELKQMLNGTGEFSVCHVDGEHSEAATLADLLNVSEFMSENGVIVLDDWCHPMFPGVQSALHLFMQQSDYRIFAVTDRKAYLARRRRFSEIQDSLVGALLASSEFNWTWQHGRVPLGTRGKSEVVAVPEVGVVAEYEISSEVLGSRVLLMVGNRK